MSDKKTITNRRDGHHLNAKHWQQYKQGLPPLPKHLEECLIGMILGDASVYRISREAFVKFEQGYKPEPFVKHLFDLFRIYCFMIQSGQRVERQGERIGQIKSFWFKTFSHPSFPKIWQLFFDTGTTKRKCVRSGLVLDHLTSRGLAYWIMCDGSLQKDQLSMVLHTQGYTREENECLSTELNTKFGFLSRVLLHKKKYWVVHIGSNDAELLSNLIRPYFISSMLYKLPKQKHTASK